MTVTTTNARTEPILITEMSEPIEDSGPVAELAARVADGRTRLVLARDDKAVAAVVSTRDLERLRQLDERSAELWRLLNEIGERFADVPPEEIEREAVRAVAWAREQRRTRASASQSRSDTQ
jgi:hypothetical protein